MLYRETVDLAPSLPIPISPDVIFSRICVRPPYFALSHITAEPGRLYASVTAERPVGAERGAIQGAELSRHAAIAGLCVAALAQHDDQRRYYLAQQAHFEGFPSEAIYGAEVRLEAELLELTKREARARIVARADDQVIAVVEVLYSILADAAFARLFRSRARPEFSGTGQTSMSELPVVATLQRGDSWTRVIEAVPERACAGHFEGFPAMPVAILMGQLCELAGAALGPGQPYVVASAAVEARDFCWAGEPVTFEVQRLTQEGPKVTFRCLASAAGRTAGEMELVLFAR